MLLIDKNMDRFNQVIKIIHEDVELRAQKFPLWTTSLKPAIKGDKWDEFLQDGPFYMYGGAHSLLAMFQANIAFKNYHKSVCEELYRDAFFVNLTYEKLVRKIVDEVMKLVTNDGDNICDRNSVGWYTAIMIFYVCYCVQNYERNFHVLFLDVWNLYFSDKIQK